MLVWRVWEAGLATKGELETPGVWSLDDVLKANALLDHRVAQEWANRPQGGKG